MKQWILAGLAALLAAQAWAGAVEQRQDVFKQYKKTVGPMSKMIKGEQPYDKAAFAGLAAELATLSQQPWQYFPAGSTQGKTEAKAEIWSQPQAWQQKIDQHKAAVGELKKVADSGDLAAIKPQFGKTMGSCKSCHDQFRKD